MPVAELVEPDRSQRLGRTLRSLLTGGPIGQQGEGHVLSHRHPRQQGPAVVLEHQRQLVRGPIDLPPGEICRPLARWHQTGDHLEQRGLAATRRPHHAEELALFDVEGQVVDGDHARRPLPVDLAEPAYFQLWHFSSSLLSPASLHANLDATPAPAVRRTGRAGSRCIPADRGRRHPSTSPPPDRSPGRR